MKKERITNLIRILSTKRFLSLLLIGLIATNFLYTSIIPSITGIALKQVFSTPDSDSYFGDNSYTGVNCTKLNEYDSNLGETIWDFSAAEFSNKKVAYISTECSILAFDFSDPKKPKYISTIDFGYLNYIYNIDAINNLLIVDFSYTGIAIIDFSNLKKPQIIFNGQISNVSNLDDCIIKDDILYGRDWNALILLDISTISSPKYLNKYEGTITNFTSIVSIYLENDYAYLMYIDSFEIVDISDFTAPVQLGIFNSTNNINGTFTDISVSGNIAYTVTTGGQVFAIDCSDPSNPSLLDYSMDNTKIFNQIDIDESLAYVLDQETGIHVFDIYNPTEITLISRNNNAGDYRTQQLISDYLFLFNRNEGIEIYSILDHQNPTFVSIYLLSGRGYDVAISGKTVLVANGFSGLEIYHINNFNKPIFRSRILSGKLCIFVQIRGELAYVYSENAKEADVHIIDFSDLENPVLLQTESILADSNGFGPISMQICGDYFIASYSDHPWDHPKSLRVYDLSTKTNFELVEQIELGLFFNFAYKDNNLYLIDFENFSIYSYEPHNLSLISQTPLNLVPYIYSFHISDNYAFVTTEYDTQVFDITNPFSPVETFRFSQIALNTSYGYKEVIVSADIIYVLERYYVSSRGSNLYFINFEDRNSPYLEGSFSCDEFLTSFDVSENKVYLSALEVNLEIVQLDRFISRTVIIVVASIVSVIIISGIAVLVLVLRRRKIRRASEKAKSVENSEIKEES